MILNSTTDTHHAHKAWKLLDRAEGGIGPIQYPMIGDITKSISQAYDVLLPDGLCARGIFVIDKSYPREFSF